MAPGLGGEEGLEYLGQVFRRDALPAVGELQKHLLVALAPPAPHAQLAALGHGLDGVEHQVGEHLLQLRRVAPHQQGLALQLQRQLHPAQLHAVGGEGDGGPEQLAQIHDARGELVLAGEGEQVAHDAAAALRLLAAQGQVIAVLPRLGRRGLAAPQPLVDQLGEVEDGGDGVVDLMGHRGHQLAQGDELVFLHQGGQVGLDGFGAPLHPPGEVVGDVPEQLQHLHHLALAVDQGEGGHVAVVGAAVGLRVLVDGVGALARGQGLLHGAGGVRAVAGGERLMADLEAVAPQGFLPVDARRVQGRLVGPHDAVVRVQDHDPLAGGVDEGLGKGFGNADLVLALLQLLVDGHDVVEQARGGVADDLGRVRVVVGQVVQKLLVVGQLDDEVEVFQGAQLSAFSGGEKAPFAGQPYASGLRVQVGHPHHLNLQPPQALRIQHIEHRQTALAATDDGQAHGPPLLGCPLGHRPLHAPEIRTYPSGVCPYYRYKGRAKRGVDFLCRNYNMLQFRFHAGRPGAIAM